jgi:hypothetical protein
MFKSVVGIIYVFYLCRYLKLSFYLKKTNTY